MYITVKKCFVVQTPGSCVIKIFTTVIVAVSQKARLFTNAIHFHHSLIFSGKAEAYQKESPYDKLLALSVNIRVGYKWMAVANTLAYYDTVTITVVKSFLV